MPSLSPGDNEPSSFDQILPGNPSAGYQSVSTFVFRWRRYITYICGRQLNILRGPTELIQAVTFEKELVGVIAEAEDKGRIAVATIDAVWILKPSTSAWNRVQWTNELLLKNKSTKNEIRTLSWAAEGELLVGGTQHLALFDTLPPSRVSSPATSPSKESDVEERNEAWIKSIACPVRFAMISPSAGLLATTGCTDRLVKVWRRLSYEEAIFDFCYLPHDGIVTHLEWRLADIAKLEDDVPHNGSIRSYHGADEPCEVLYTISSDGNLRIWRTNSHNDLDMLSLYTKIDLVSAIPHSPTLTMNGTSHRPARHAFVISSSSYSAAVSAALKKHPQGQVKHSIEHLKEVMSKEPDVIVALDTQGRMSAWGLSSIGHKRRPESHADAAKSPFHIAHTEAIGISFQQGLSTSFETWFDGDVLNIVAHSFGSTIKWWQGTIENFSSSAALDVERGVQIAVWQGNAGKLTGLQTSSTSSLLSWTGTGELREWSESDGALHFAKKVNLDDRILDAASVQRDRSLLVLGDRELHLARIADGKSTISKKHALSDVPDLTLLQLECATSSDEKFIIYDRNGRYCTVLVNPTRGEWTSEEPTIQLSSQVRTFSLGEKDLVQVDAVIHPRKSGWLRLAGVDDKGFVYRKDVSNATIDGEDKTVTERTLTFATSIPAGSMVMNSSCAAVLSAEGSELVIIDLKEGYIEHRQRLPGSARHLLFPRSNIDDVALTQHSVLAVSFDTSVELLARSRYDHLHHDAEPRWTSIKKISIGDVGLSISSIAWLPEGQLAIAAGNNIFTSDRRIAVNLLTTNTRQQLELTEDTNRSVDELVDIMRGPITCWQPHVLRQLVLHGYFDAVVKILLQLQSKLRFFTDGDELDALLDLDIDLLLDSKTKTSHNSDDVDFSQLGEQLEELNLPYTSDEDQERLKLLVQTVAYTSRHIQSLDLNAVRYLTHWRYHVLLGHRHNHTVTANGSLSPDHAVDSSAFKAVPQMGWREVSFAYQSSTQQPLLEILLQYYENKLEWSTVRALGLTLWLHNIKAAQSEGANMASVEQVFEAVGQSAYRASQSPDPADASLFLLALKKKAVLLSLWRVAVGNREQKSTQNFLRRNFGMEENKTAARKNAYALMGKRRFQYAAAFFLLADDPMSAISILAGQCEDLQLAVSVARAYCGDGSTMLHKFIHDRVVPDAQKSANRWLLAWAHAITSQPAQVIRALIIDVDRLSESSGHKPIRTWRQDDPVTLTIYSELRAKLPDKFPLPTTPLDEYRAVLRASRVLRHMGYWLLAFKLVQHWSFPQTGLLRRSGERSTTGEAVQSSEVQSSGVPSMLDEFEDQSGSRTADIVTAQAPSMLDMVTDTMSAPKNDADDRAAKAAALLAKMRATKKSDSTHTDAAKQTEEKQQASQFKEPATSSILDSFGF